MCISAKRIATLDLVFARHVFINFAHHWPANVVFVWADVGVADPSEEGPRPGGGPLHQQRSNGPWAPLPGGPKWQEHGDRVEEGGVRLSNTGQTLSANHKWRSRFLIQALKVCLPTHNSLLLCLLWSFWFCWINCSVLIAKWGDTKVIELTAFLCYKLAVVKFPGILCLHLGSLNGKLAQKTEQNVNLWECSYKRDVKMSDPTITTVRNSQIQSKIQHDALLEMYGPKFV